MKVVKNKVAAPFKEVEFDIMYGTGISREGDLLDLAVTDNIVEKSGSWFSFGGERIGQGRENVKEYLREHPEMMKEIEQRVLTHHGLLKSPVAAVPDAPEGEGEPEPTKRRVKAVK